MTDGDDEVTSPGRPPPPPGGYTAWALENVALNMSRAATNLGELAAELRRMSRPLSPVQAEDVCATFRNLGYELQAAAAILDGQRAPPAARSRR